MNAVAQALCIFCVVMGNGPNPQIAHRDGDIRYTHESLRHGRHLLRLSTTDFILDSDQYRNDRLYAFAQQLADRTCQGRFKLADAERRSWPKIRSTYAKQFVFHCE